MAKNFGFNWSWKRAIGLTQLRATIAKKTGVPTSMNGIYRKIGRTIVKSILK